MVNLQIIITQTCIKHINPTCFNFSPCGLSRLSPEERAQVEAQLDELTATYNQLCDSSTQQLQQLEQQLAKEEERKVDWWEERAEMERRCCRFVTKNVFFQLLQACQNDNCEKCCFKSEYACELSVSSRVGQQECVCCTACCVFTECAFLTNITTIVESHSLTWFGLTNITDPFQTCVQMI